MSRGRVVGLCRSCGQPRPMGDVLGRAYRRVYWRLYGQAAVGFISDSVHGRRLSALARVRRAAIEGHLDLRSAIRRFDRIAPRRTP